MLFACSASMQAYGQQQLTLKPRAIQQVNALMEEKASRTPAQRKISSALLVEIKRRRGELPAGKLPKLRRQVEVERDGTVGVDIKGKVTRGLLQRIEAVGGRIVSQNPRFDAIRAYVPLDELEGIAARGEVRSIRPAERPIINKINTSEGDVAHRADEARAGFGVNGAGVKACALSDSVDALDDLQASGDLPQELDILAGQSGNPGASEGTAMLEIIYDLAPGASLGFATASGGQPQFAQNILDLEAAGCDVIVDDIFYFAEPVFQDGIVAQAVDTVAALGVLYFSSAGNSGNLNDGTAGVWEGTYSPTDAPPALQDTWLSAHDFGSGVNSNEITVDPPFAITLHWNDPQGQSDSDYDLFLFDPALENVVALSTGTQDGTQDPFESIDSVGFDDTGGRIVVALFSNGGGSFMHLNTLRGQLDVATDGQISGHAAARGAMAVAAVDVATAGGGAFTGGAANPVETFSSDGPRRVFFAPDGSPITDGTANELRQKPEIAAADGVSTATPGFNVFFGTSAAAPHAAAIAALIRQRHPALSVRGAGRLFQVHALDIEAPGIDRDSGAGIVDTVDAFDALIFADGFESGDISAWRH